MNKAETVQVITFLAGNYDSIAKKEESQKRIMIETWYECLQDLDYKTVMSAIKRVIMTSQYPPTIHEVRKAVTEMTNLEVRTGIEAWDEAINMISNGIYMTQEEFEKHNEDVKKFFVSVKQVKELAQIESKIINSVTKGQFLKQFEVLQEREIKQKMLPEKYNKIITELANKMSLGG